MIGNPDVQRRIQRFANYSIQKWRRRNLKVACILDTFSYECFKYECYLEQLRLSTWKHQLERLKPDFVFIESAWSGLGDSWKHQLTNSKKRPKSQFKRLMEYCKRKGIVTVFWNKEDSLHYKNFIGTAKLFDYIFTTDKNCVAMYKRDTGHDRIDVLPFAAQPAIHNPVGLSSSEKKGVAFAGTWYHRYLQRKLDMHVVLNPAKEFGLNIFDRTLGEKGSKYPELYHPNIVGSLNYSNILKAYKLYQVFLNVNSIKDSPTMFSRRVFELLACGTNVISTPSKGISSMFNGIVQVASTQEETKRHITELFNNRDYSERLSLLGVREVYSRHLYQHRMEHILKKLGLLAESEQEEGVSVIAYLDEKKTIHVLLENFHRQVVANKELIIVTNKNDKKARDWSDIVEKHQNVCLYQLPADRTIDECLRFAASKCRYHYLSFFAEECFYGPHFLQDLIHAFIYTDADAVGKGTYFAKMNGEKGIRLCSPEKENKFVHALCLPSIVMTKQTLERIQVPLECDGIGEELFKHCVGKGLRLYSADKYNFIYYKSKMSSHEDKLFHGSLRVEMDDYLKYVSV